MHHHHWSSHWERQLGAARAPPACSLRGNTDAQAAQGKTLRRPVAFRAVPLYRSQDSAYHRTYHEAAVSFIRTWAKTSTTTGPNCSHPIHGCLSRAASPGSPGRGLRWLSVCLLTLDLWPGVWTPGRRVEESGPGTPARVFPPAPYQGTGGFFPRTGGSPQLYSRMKFRRSLILYQGEALPRQSPFPGGNPADGFYPSGFTARRNFAG